MFVSKLYFYIFLPDQVIAVKNYNICSFKIVNKSYLNQAIYQDQIETFYIFYNVFQKARL